MLLDNFNGSVISAEVKPKGQFNAEVCQKRVSRRDSVFPLTIGSRVHLVRQIPSVKQRPNYAIPHRGCAFGNRLQLTLLGPLGRIQKL